MSTRFEKQAFSFLQSKIHCLGLAWFFVVLLGAFSKYIFCKGRWNVSKQLEEINIALENIILCLCKQCSYYSYLFEHIELEYSAKPACLILKSCFDNAEPYISMNKEQRSKNL